MVEISRLDLRNQVVEHARSLFPEFDADSERWLTTVYDGKPGLKPDYLPYAYDDAGHVRPYVCVYTSPGAPSADVDLAGQHNDLDWMFQLTAVGAFDADVDFLFDRLVPGFRAWIPDLGPDLAGLIEAEAAKQLNVPGMHLVDPGPTPDRVFNVLQYGISLTT